MLKSNEAKKIFTGRHFLIWIVSFFLVIFIANGAILYFSFGVWQGRPISNSNSFYKSPPAANIVPDAETTKSE